MGRDRRGRDLELTEALVALCHREVPREPAREGFSVATPEDCDVVARRLDAAAGPEPVQVFAYGSLIWKPEVPVAQRRVAMVHGWHRDFTLRVEGGRGTPGAPSYMLGLMPGGRCRGVLLELGGEDRLDSLRALVQRELPFREFHDQTRWIMAQTDDGPRRALAFWAGRYPPLDATGVPESEKARHLAVACGWLGSGAEYLFQTVQSLAAAGIHDPALWRMQARVAAEIRARHGLA